MADGDTVVNAIIGAVVGVILSGFIPFAPVIGGAISGYLQGGTRSEGVRIGAIAGAMMLVPFVLFFVLLGPVFFGFFGGMAGMGHLGLPGGVTVVFLIGSFLVGIVYTVGLSAVGGFLGNYVKNDTDIDI